MSAPATPPPPRLTRVLRAAIRHGSTAALALAYGGILVRIAWRDTLALAAPLYYAIPPIVAAGLAAVASVLDWRCGSRERPRAGRLALIVLLLAWQAKHSWRNHEPRTGELRALVWNTAHGTAGWDRIADDIAVRDPDIVALVEAGGAVDGLRRRMGGYAWVDGGSGFVVGVRGVDTAVALERVDLGEGGRALLFTIDGPTRKLLGLLVDVLPDPRRHRALAFEHLDRQVAGRALDLVVGDFNTPRDSAFFDPWRARLRHAFDDAGRGFDATWPWPLPVLAIDHAWSGPRLEPRACRLEGTWRSDHRMVIADYTWVPR